MRNFPDPAVVLASASEVRSRILEGVGIDHVIDPAGLDESDIKSRNRDQGSGVVAALLAEAKATQVSQRHPGALVIGADQILDLDGFWFDKPKTQTEAEAHLRKLRGLTHTLLSAVSVVRDGQSLWRHVGEARLTMRPFGDEFLAAYLDQAGPDILDSVGAYRLEGLGAQLFSEIKGDYFTVLGLPLLPLLAFLRGEGIVLT
jgi:septum formation protein